MPDPPTVTDLDELLAALEAKPQPGPLDDVVAHHLREAGLVTSDENAKRLIALAAHQYLTDVAAAAVAHATHRQAQPEGATSPTTELVLLEEDVLFALRQLSRP
eukprot:GGOE01049496.1.p3 GENE.GGOE01049496.1~~GGOE01049496.1.p3  ORF type:complete len:104 (+),score=27.31 GGOE01049496.1:153-464(+)